MSIKVFYHIYCTDKTLPIVKDQIAKIMFSGLYEKTFAIYCFVTGRPEYIQSVCEWIQHSGVKFHIAKCVPGDTTYERFTLLEIPKYIVPEDKFLYMHSKGISKTDNICVQDWTTFLEYFTIGKHADCIRALDTYDTAGANYQLDPQPHYSGNFWWSTGKYYLSLDFNVLQTDMHYNAPEFFICQKNPQCMNLCRGNRNHYGDRYPMICYVDRGSNR